MNSIQFLIAALLVIDLHLNQALFLSNLSVPRLIDATQKAKLFCSYEMGNRTLNSVKWYKDGHEFFRYSPLTPPTTNWFPVEGVTIAQGSSHCNQFICNVELEKLTVLSSGAYRCEVSGDAPEFKLIDKTANMTVGVLPKLDPYIRGIMESYKYGDFLVANCSSDWSYPAAKLTWYINNATAPIAAVTTPQINAISRVIEGFPVYSGILELRLHFHDSRFITKSEALELKCVADIMGIATVRRQRWVRVAILALKDAGHKQRLMGTTSIANHITMDLRLCYMVAFLNIAWFKGFKCRAVFNWR